MTEPIYVARASVRPEGVLHRRATLPLGATADFGVHGAVQELFHLAPPQPLPLPVDYIVAAAAG